MRTVNWNCSSLCSVVGSTPASPSCREVQEEKKELKRENGAPKKSGRKSRDIQTRRKEEEKPPSRQATFLRNTATVPMQKQACVRRHCFVPTMGSALPPPPPPPPPRYDHSEQRLQKPSQSISCSVPNINHNFFGGFRKIIFFRGFVYFLLMDPLRDFGAFWTKKNIFVKRVCSAQIKVVLQFSMATKF